VSAILKEHKITAAHSMARAIKRANAERFDLYLFDYRLPDEMGLELCLLLKAFDRDAQSYSPLAQVQKAGAQGFGQQ
jgi:DNA-binding response OmpR family regulator